MPLELFLADLHVSYYIYLFIYLSVAKPKIGSVNRGGAKTLIRFSRAKLETKI
jgi:hypothetical protein